jgi:hypothetical protein
LSVYNRYILSLVLSTCLANGLLAFWGQNNLQVYFAVNAIVYLVITLFYGDLNRIAKRALTTIGCVLFCGFMIIVVFQLMDIVSRR